MNKLLNDKIQDLGGKKGIDAGKITMNDIALGVEKLEERFDVALPKEYIEFNKEHCPFLFNKMVRTKLAVATPIGDQNNSVPVDYFYSLSTKLDNLDYCAIKVLEDYSEQLPAGYLPICEGVDGDLICLCLDKKDFAKVFYWFHEAPIGKDVFLIADSFNEFVINLFPEGDNYPVQDKVEGTITLSPQLLEMLKKSGYGPGGGK